MFDVSDLTVEARLTRKGGKWQIVLHGPTWALDDVWREVEQQRTVWYISGGHFSSSTPDQREIALSQAPHALIADHEMSRLQTTLEQQREMPETW